MRVQWSLCISEHSCHLIKCHEVLATDINLNTKNKLHALPVWYVYKMTINGTYWYNSEQSRLDKGNGLPCFFSERSIWVVTVKENERISCTEQAAVLLVSPVSPAVSQGPWMSKEWLQRRGQGGKMIQDLRITGGLWWTIWHTGNRSGYWKWNRFQGAEESGRALQKRSQQPKPKISQPGTLAVYIERQNGSHQLFY